MRPKDDPSQLEFDWLSLHLVREPTLAELEDVRQKTCWPAPQNFEDVDRLRNLAVRLSWLDLHYRDVRVSNDDLVRARFLLPAGEWQHEKKFWRRLAQRDPLRFRKILLVAQKKIAVNQPTNTNQ